MLKKIIFGFTGILLILGLSWYFWSDDRTLKNVPLRPNGPIVFFGDSLVEGVGATAGHDLPALLSEGLGEPVLNYGIAGNTTRLGKARAGAMVGETHPRLVLLLLGGNDFIQKVPRDETFANLEQIITSFQSDGAAVMLIVVRSGLIGGGADEAYEALAEKTESLYVEDVLQGVFGDSALMSDAIHPNDRGYEKIAGRLLPLIRKLLVE